jgi:glycosyltransferase involved in cell wall biosynthesis
MLPLRYLAAKASRNATRANALFREALLSLPYRRRVTDQINQWIRSPEVDIVQVDYPWLASLGERMECRPPKVFIAHEIQAQLVSQLTSDTGLIDRVREVEGERMRSFDAVITLSPEDQAYTSEMGVKNVLYSPLAISGAEQCFPARPLINPITLTFIGGYQHSPNRDAVEWLCRDVARALDERRIEHRIRIIGRYPESFAQAYSSDRIAFLGFVEDLREAVTGTIFVCPLRLGSGMRIKILDAIACGAPVISTRLGARGLGLIDGESYLAAESPADFAQRVQQLIQEAGLCAHLVARSQSHIVSRFSPTAVARRRTEVLQSVIDMHKAHQHA